jgi:hypothetical protein
MFSDEQLARIVSRGWSTTLVGEIHSEHSDLSLAELSALVKGLCTEWSALAKNHAFRAEP